MPSTRLVWPLACVASLAGALGIATVWTAAATASGHSAGGMALLAAADAVLMLRLAGVRPGYPRAGVAVLATLLTAALAQWLIAAVRLGQVLGLTPLASAAKLGPSLAWQLIQQGNGPLDLLWLGAALLVAAGWGRGHLARHGLSGRRRAP